MIEKERSAVKLQADCDACGKLLSTSKDSSITNWLFRRDRCGCPQQEAVWDEPAAPSDVDDNDVSSRVVELPQLGERYEVIDSIGHGGMGEVFRVREKLTGQIMAAKVLSQKADNDVEAIKRFEAEAQAVTRLNHANIVEVFDHGRTSNGAPYMVMNLIAGDNLSRYLKKNRKLEQSVALRLLIDIAEALSYAHKSGLLHRDLKPSNVIVTDSDESAKIGARLVDFGIAKVMSATQSRDTQDLTKTGAVFGSPAYMSPEQCLGFKLDERSDIYSFGCLMYEVLSGGPALRADNPVQAIVAQLKEKPKSWTNTPDGKPLKGLEAIAFRCLEKDKEDRYQSVDDLLRDLKLVSAGKQPAKFEREKPEKAVLSAGQAVVIFIDFMVALMYSLMVSFSLAFASLVALASPVLVALLFAHVKKHGLHGSNWSRWRLLFKATWCALALTAIFLSTVMFPIWDGASDAVCWLYPAVFAVHMLLVNLLLGIVGGSFFLHDNGKNDWKQIGKQTAQMTLVFLVVGLCSAGLQNSFNSATETNLLSSSKPRVQIAMSKAAILAGGDKVQSAELIACSFLQLKHPSEALPYLNEAIASKPANWRLSELYVERAKVYQALGRLETALSEVKLAVKVNSADQFNAWESRSLEGDIYKEMGNFKQALESYTASSETRSNINPVLRKRGRLNLRMGDWSNAIKDLTAEVDRNNLSADLYLERAIAYDKAGDTAKAAQDYQKVVSLLQEQKNEDVFQFVVKQLMKRNMADALLLKSYAHQRLGQLADSKRDFTKAVADGAEPDSFLKDFQKDTGIHIQLDGGK
ncbi:MAG: protein kinase [Candidatus Obscuribacterales bacterium]|nr:protein kinase [Candidatus Obscuribacterales bacterium]